VTMPLHAHAVLICTVIRNAPFATGVRKMSTDVSHQSAQVPGLQDAEDEPTDDGNAGAQYYHSARRSREFNEAATGKPINRQSSLLDLQEEQE